MASTDPASAFMAMWATRWSKIGIPRQLSAGGAVRRLDVGELLGKSSPRGVEAQALVDGIFADLKSVLKGETTFWSPAPGLIDIFYPKQLRQTADLTHSVVGSTIERRVRDAVAAQAKPIPVKPAVPVRRVTWEDFQQKCRKAQARPDQVQKIDVSELILGMADPNARLSRRSWRIVDEILDEFLGGGGYCTRYPGNLVLLFFPGLSASLGRLKCRAITREIERRIGEVARRGEPAETDPEIEAEGMPAAPASRAESEAPPESSEEVARLNKAFTALAAVAKNTGPSESELRMPDGIDLRTVPVWRAGNQTLVGYVVQPARRGETTAPPEEAVDFPVLAHAQGDILRRAEGQSPYLVILPLSWRTIERATTRVKYIEMAARIPEDVRRYMVMSLYGIPEDLLTARIEERVRELRKYCRTLMCRVELDRREFDQLKGQGFHGIGVELPTEGPAERDIMTAMDGFLDALAPLQVKSFVNGLHTKSLVIAALAAGFDYLSGPAISDAGETHGVRAFSIPDLYETPDGQS